jgi:hypothetical protein
VSLEARSSVRPTRRRASPVHAPGWCLAPTWPLSQTTELNRNRNKTATVQRFQICDPSVIRPNTPPPPRHIRPCGTRTKPLRGSDIFRPTSGPM